MGRLILPLGTELLLGLDGSSHLSSRHLRVDTNRSASGRTKRLLLLLLIVLVRCLTVLLVLLLLSRLTKLTRLTRLLLELHHVGWLLAEPVLLRRSGRERLAAGGSIVLLTRLSLCKGKMLVLVPQTWGRRDGRLVS